jgi:hypothetical protein
MHDGYLKTSNYCYYDVMGFQGCASMAIRTMRKNSVAREHEIQHFEGFVLFEGVRCVVGFWLLRLFCAGWLHGEYRAPGIFIGNVFINV